MSLRERTRPNWSRPLPRRLKIPTVMTLKTLADVRELIARHLPARCRVQHIWRHVADQLAAAARGGSIDRVTDSSNHAFLCEPNRYRWAVDPHKTNRYARRTALD
jgi:hypothetical protein